MAERGDEHLAVVLAGRRVPVSGARGIRPVGHELIEAGALGPEPTQPPGQPVVRQGDGGDASRVLGLVVAQPAQLRDRERRDRHEAGAVGQGCGPELADQVFRRLRGTGVVPQQGVADDASLGIEGDQAVLLPADRPGLDVIEATGIRDGRLQRDPPCLGIDRRAIGMRSAAGAHDGTRLGVDDDDLAGLGRGVDPENECHRRTQRAPSRCSVASCCRRTKPKPLPPRYAFASKSS